MIETSGDLYLCIAKRRGLTPSGLERAPWIGDKLLLRRMADVFVESYEKPDSLVSDDGRDPLLRFVLTYDWKSYERHRAILSLLPGD